MTFLSLSFFFLKNELVDFKVSIFLDFKEITRSIAMIQALLQFCLISPSTIDKEVT